VTNKVKARREDKRGDIRFFLIVMETIATGVPARQDAYPDNSLPTA
jgi:hypothetical protein